MECFLGQLILCSFSRVPDGFVLCDGRQLLIRDNQALFSLLGTTFGGDGVNTFAVPDLRGRAALGAGPNYPLGQKAGQERVSVNAAQLPAHTHPMMATTAADAGTPAGALFAGSGSANAYGPAPSGAPVVLQSDAMLNSGGGQSHENRQPYLVMNWVIATRGIYPPRN
jgi:microcystin-dependent protein